MSCTGTCRTGNATPGHAQTVTRHLGVETFSIICSGQHNSLTSSTHQSSNRHARIKSSTAEERGNLRKHSLIHLLVNFTLLSPRGDLRRGFEMSYVMFCSAGSLIFSLHVRRHGMCIRVKGPQKRLEGFPHSCSQTVDWMWCFTSTPHRRSSCWELCGWGCLNISMQWSYPTSSLLKFTHSTEYFCRTVESHVISLSYQLKDICCFITIVMLGFFARGGPMCNEMIDF